MELIHGSPTDMTGRSSREIRAYKFLDRLGVEFDRTDHPDLASDIHGGLRKSRHHF